eukprot:m.60397 g.60397  ORF g.60397 m.60397 type:complete len:699 (-) comp7954_c0_seq1:15-2111(-)
MDNGSPVQTVKKKSFVSIVSGGDRTRPNSSSTYASHRVSSASSTVSDADDGSVRLLLISSDVKSCAVLLDAVHAHVNNVVYDYSSTTPEELVQEATTALQGRPADSIAIIAYGDAGRLFLLGAPAHPSSPGSEHEVGGDVNTRTLEVSAQTLGDDATARQCMQSLASLLVKGGRLDVLATAAAVANEGGVLHRALQEVCGTDIVLSSHIGNTGCSVSRQRASSATSAQSQVMMNDDSGVTHGTLEIDTVYGQYFNLARLRAWAGPYTQTLAEYERVREIGRGAFGVAVLYRKRDDGNYVILKSVDLHALTTKERQLALNEHVVLGMLDHPNIIQYYDCFEEHGTLQIEMEYADGGTLAQYLAKRQGRPLSHPAIVSLLVGISSALEHIHGHDILHRDLKSDNVFLMLSGEIKLGDFGIAKQLSTSSQGGRKKTNTLLGTPHYISPELCSGNPYDSKSDMWSLGCILHEMVTLNKAFTSENLPALVNKIMECDYEPLPEDTPQDIKSLIARLLSFDPEMRPTATQVLAEPMCAAHTQRTTTRPSTSSVFGDVESSGLMSHVYYWERDASVPRQFVFENSIRIVGVGIGEAHCCAVSANGLLFSWGSNQHGQLGHGDYVDRSEPDVVAALLTNGVAKVACGGNVTAIITFNGLLQVCGEAAHGALGCGDTTTDQPVPQIVQALMSTQVMDVAVGSYVKYL